MVKAIIFDCFGVLYPDFSGNFFQKYENYFNQDSEFLDKLNLQIDLGKITRAEFFMALEKKTGIPAKEIQSEMDEKLVVSQELVGLIKKLKVKYKIGLLSNAGQEEIEVVYRDKLNTLFDNITVSYQLGVVKPSPEIYLSCIKGLGVQPEESLFIDDSKLNIDVAIRLGMKGVVYDNSVSLLEYLARTGIDLNK